MTELGIELNDTSVELGIEIGNEAINYNTLANKPQINSVTLEGNKTGSQLGLAQVDEVYTKTQTDTLLNAKADKSTTYTKSETDTLLNAKQDTISDLSSIRAGATLGSTSIQPNDNISELTNDAGYLTQHQSLSNYYTKTETDSAISSHHDSSKQDTLVSGTNIKTINNQSLLGGGNIEIGGGSSDYSTLTNKPQINNVTLSGNKSLSDLGINIPTKTSDLTNDGDGTNPFLTQHQSLENYSTTAQMNTAISTATNDMATQTWVGQQGYLTEHQSLSAYRTSANQDLIDATKEDSSNKVTSLSSSSTDTQYPSAKCVYDIVGNIESTLQSIRGVQ